MPKLRFMISGGGTGGHIFPALAIADELKERHPEAEFLFVGAKDKMEMEKVPQAGYPIKGLWISGIQRSLSLKNLSFPFKLISSLWKSYFLIRDFKPNAVIGTGGFASGPLLYMASRAKIPCLIQEQNSYPGITNKLLANRVAKICVAYDRMKRFFPKDKIVLSGNPLRQGLEKSLPASSEAKEKLGLNGNKLSLMVLGGSLGARRINQLISESISELQALDINLIWQCGKLYYEELKTTHNSLPDNFKLQAFIGDMREAYSAADVVISRAGANTLSELAAVGKASILIPSPNVAEDHQTKNAQALSFHDAAILFEEKGKASELVDLVRTLVMDSSKAEGLQRNISKLALPNAAAIIADEIDQLVKHA